MKENKLLFDSYKKVYTIKEKFLREFSINEAQKIQISDIKNLNMKEYIEIFRDRLMNYYKNK
jgi:hypothetical protein